MFFKSLLQIANPKTRMMEDPTKFLRLVIKKYLLRFPFQNVTSFGAYRFGRRPVPTIREIVQANVKGVGGLCGHMNGFLKLQLESIGYKTTLIPGKFVRTKVNNSHCIFLVHIPGHMNCEGEDRNYVVDVGCGVPLCEPICLEKLPYVSKAGGLYFLYCYVDQTTIRRIHLHGDAILGKMPAEFVSPQDYTATLISQDYGSFQNAVEKVYTDGTTTAFHHGLYLFKYLEISDEDFKIACVVGNDLLIITKDERHCTHFKSYRDLKPYIDQHFSMLDPLELEKAEQNFKLV